MTRTSNLGARSSRSVCFFFQAGDGIRSADVTGVQTCALPISHCGIDVPAVGAIVLENVGKVYSGDVVAVDDISLEVESGEFLVLVGPSGCGKSTLLRMRSEERRVGKEWTLGVGP